jgi:hypothetical protein
VPWAVTGQIRQAQGITIHGGIVERRQSVDGHDRGSYYTTDRLIYGQQLLPGNWAGRSDGT